MAIVTTSQNITAVSYTAGEIIEIRNGATLTIDATPATRPGTIQCITSGKLRVENSSTTIPIVVALEDMARDFRFEGNGVMEVRGAMMELGTGTGSAQTFDFSTLYSGVLTDVTYVEVEQTAGSGDYMPWHIVEVASRYYHVGRVADRGSVTSDFDGNQPVFFFNSDTRVLSSGNGTNGMSVPSGCKIRIPNILLTNQDWQPDASLSHRIVSEGVPTGGTFTITVVNGRTGATLGTTGNLNFNATAAQIDTALEAVLGAGTITNTGGPLPTLVAITLAGAYASTPLRFQVNSSVTGGTNSVVYSLENSTTSMTLLDLSPSGTLDAEMCAFSRKVNVANSAFSSIRAVRVGFGGHGRAFSSSNGNVTMDHTHSCVPPYAVLASHSVNSVFGAVSLRKTVTTTGMTQTNSVHQNLPGLTLDEDTRHLAYGSRASASATCFAHVTLPNIDIVRPRVVGGRHVLQNLVGNNIVNPSGADHPGTAQLTTNAQSQWGLVNAVGVRIINPTKAGTASVRNWAFIVGGDCSNIEVYGGSYDFANNGSGAFNPSGSGLLAQNFPATNVRASTLTHDLPTSFAATSSRIRKCFASTASGDTGFDSCQDGEFDLAGCSIAGFNEVHAGVENFVGGNFADLGATPTTGHVTFGAFGRGTGMSLSGAAYTDQIGGIKLEVNGDSAVATIPFAMHGVTDFQNVASTFVAESEGGFSDRWRILNDGGVTGGTFTLTFYDSSNTLIGTTGTIAYNASTATVDTAVETVLGASTVTVSGSLSAGYVINVTAGTIVRCTVDGALLTGGTKAGTANSLGRHNVGIALGTALTTGTTIGGMTIESSMRLPAGTWTSYSTLSAVNLISQFASLTGYDANDGFEMRLRFTATSDDVYRYVSQVSMPTNIDPSLWLLSDASITLQGPNPTDVSRIVRVSDNTVIYSFTGGGTFDFQIGSNYNTECYLRREDSGGTVLMRTLPKTIFLKFGSNGTCPLFYGDEVQLAQSSDVVAIRQKVDAYLDATISSRLAAAGYATPPTASANATAVRSELATELSRIDVAVSSRNATAPDNAGIAAIKAKTDNLPSDPADESSIQAAIASIPAAPNASTVASAVRTELTTELGRIDVATSTRLATLGATAPANWINAASIAAGSLDGKGNWNVGKTGYSLIQVFPANFAALGINSSGHVSRVTLVDTTTVNADMRGTDNALLASSYVSPPSAATNATAVRTELATELARIDVATSTRLASASYTAPDNTLLAAVAAYVDTEVAAIKAVTDKLDSTLVLDGSVYQFTANALENGSVDAAGIRSAIGMSTSNLDVQLAAIVQDTGTTIPQQITSELAAVQSAITSVIPSSGTVSDAVMAKELETGFTVARTLRIVAASTAGKVTGGPGGPIFRNLSDTADQITGVATADGNRTSATYGS
jgi:hypothetical protein